MLERSVIKIIMRHPIKETPSHVMGEAVNKVGRGCFQALIFE
jgi:hypothetical protein